MPPRRLIGRRSALTASDVDLSVDIAGLHLPNPVLAASGTFGFGEEYAELIDISCLGGICTKALSLRPRAGNPPPRVGETPAGMLNAIGWQNPGIEVFLEEKLPRLQQFGVPIIVNLAGETLQEYVELATRLTDAPGISALELNISCPNVERGGMHFGLDPDLTEQLVGAVRQATDHVLITKLSPNVGDITAIAQAAVAGGSDALSLINTLVGMAIDIEQRRPLLGNVTGGLSGPAIRPIAVRMTWQVARAVDVPIIGMGGIMTAEDALEFIMAGATAVGVGTASFVDPNAALRVIDGLREHCQQHQITRITEIVGAAQPGE